MLNSRSIIGGKANAAVLSTIFVLSMSCFVDASRFALFLTSTAQLPGGSLNDCQNPNASSCTRGMALAAHRLRVSSESVPSFLLPTIDRQSIFAQMHPDTWGVNIALFRTVGLVYYQAPPSIVYSLEHNRPGRAKFFDKDVSPIITNIAPLPSSEWSFGYVSKYVVVGEFAVVVLVSENEVLCHDAITSYRTAAADIHRQHPEVNSIIVVNDNAASDYATFRNELAKDPPPTKPAVVLVSDEQEADTEYLNGTHFIVYSATSSSVLRFLFDNADTNNVTAEQSKLRLDAQMQNAAADPTYVAHHAVFLTEAIRALTNDPVVGESLNDMPIHRDGTYRPCLGGECPLGVLFTSAMMWRTGADVGFSASGGFRGNGWSASNPVRVSNLWESLPFANTVCVSTVLGLKLWEVLNYSSSVASYRPLSTIPLADHLLQQSGVRYTYDPSLPHTRLVSVEVKNRETGEWEPLDRLKKYTVVTDSFVCNAFFPFNTWFGAKKYDGETLPEQDATATLQEIVASYFAAEGPLSHQPRGLIINVSIPTMNAAGQQAAPINWADTQEACPRDTYWVSGIATCVECAEGTYQPSTGQSVCIPRPAKASLVGVYVAAPLLTVAILVLVYWGISTHLSAKKNARNVDHAPKEAPCSLIFTDIQSSTKLWSVAPQSMSLALETHHEVIRRCISNHQGYEVKTVGDSFMIAVKDSIVATKLACDIQLALSQIKFPCCIAQVYACEDDDDMLETIIDDSQNLADLDPVWNGIRVRIGVHTGSPDIVFDQVTKGYDYYGPTVNEASRIESIGHGGQICLSKSTADKLDLPVLEYHLTPCGAVTLKGVLEPMPIVQVLPASLTGRKFPPLRTEKATADEQVTDKLDDRLTFEERVETIVSVREGTVSLDFALENARNLIESFSAVLRALTPKKSAEVTKELCTAWRVFLKGDTQQQQLEKLTVCILPFILRKSARGLSRHPSAWSRRGSTMLLESHLTAGAAYRMHSPEQKDDFNIAGHCDMPGVVIVGGDTSQ